MQRLLGVKYMRKILPLIPLLVLLVGCGGSLPGSPVPVELRGQWQKILTHVPANFPYPAPPEVGISAFGTFLYFWPDGRYELLWMSTSGGYGCYSTLRWKQTGTVGIAGTAFTFRPTLATFSGVSCAGSEYKRLQAQTLTLIIAPGQDDAGWPLMRVRWPDGEELLLEKCRDCK